MPSCNSFHGSEAIRNIAAAVVLDKEEVGVTDFGGRIAGNEIRGWDTGRRKFDTIISRNGECRKSMH